MTDQIIANLVTLGFTAFTVFIAILIYKYDKRDAQKTKKISKYAENIKAYYQLEQTYIERILTNEKEKTEMMIKKECRRKFREDNDTDIIFLTPNDVER